MAVVESAEPEHAVVLVVVEPEHAGALAAVAARATVAVVVDTCAEAVAPAFDIG